VRGSALLAMLDIVIGMVVWGFCFLVLALLLELMLVLSSLSSSSNTFDKTAICADCALRTTWSVRIGLDWNGM